MEDGQPIDDGTDSIEAFEAALAASKPNLDPDADCFKPPPQNMVVECICCGEEYDSYRIEWRIFEREDGREGFWCCPIEGCYGRGFGFEIFPVDPDECARMGIEFWDDDEDEEEYDEDEDGMDIYPTSTDLPPAGDDDIPY